MSKRLAGILALCVGLLSPVGDAAARSSEPINRDWSFTLGDVANGQAVDRDTSGWQRVDVPHSFTQPYFLGTGFYVGHGWYRKTLTLPPATAGKRITLEFDGRPARAGAGQPRAGQPCGMQTQREPAPAPAGPPRLWSPDQGVFLNGNCLCLIQMCIKTGSAGVTA